MSIGHLSSGEMSIKVFCSFFFLSLDWGFFFFFFLVVVELYELFVYFGDKALVGYASFINISLVLYVVFCVFFVLCAKVYKFG